MPGGSDIVSEGNKAVVRRLVEEVMNAGDLDVLNELYAPSMANAARRWITPSSARLISPR